VVLLVYTAIVFVRCAVVDREKCPFHFIYDYRLLQRSNNIMFAENILKSSRVEKWLRIALVIIGVIALFGFVGLVSAQESPRIAGVGYFPEGVECDDAGDRGADFANKMTGDLEGCLYVFVGPGELRPSGTYIETGTELYVGGGGPGDEGTFETTYLFTAKFGDSGQHFGRCQHPIVVGSGTGDYAEVRGRLDFKDNIVNGTAVDFPYTGNLNYNG
jgi:hypothetical protein